MSVSGRVVQAWTIAWKDDWSDPPLSKTMWERERERERDVNGDMESILMEVSSSLCFFWGVNKYHSPPWFIVGAQYSLRVVYVKKSFKPPAGLYDYLSPNILFTKNFIVFNCKIYIMYYKIIYIFWITCQNIKFNP